MRVQWLGHASFMITLENGKKIITDPFPSEVGYPLPGLPADIVTVSHQHFDHSAVKNVPGSPVAVETEGRHTFDGMVIIGVPAFHDEAGGSKRGRNIIFVIEAEGLRLCHLGDLGHILEPSQVEAIGSPDVLLIPVGGFYTIDSANAARVVAQLNPRYVVPMHYKTKYLDFPISPAEPFLENYPGYTKARELSVDRTNLPANTEAVLLELKS